MSKHADFDAKALYAGLRQDDLADLRALVGFDDERLSNALYAIATEPDHVHAMAKAFELFKQAGPKAFQLLAS